MKNAATTFAALAVTAVLHAQNIELGNLSMRINTGTVMSTGGTITMGNAANRIWLGGTLMVSNPLPNALSAFNGAGIVNEQTDLAGGVAWNMAQAAAYTIPFVDASAQAVPVVITPSAASAFSRLTTVATYASASNNTPYPPTTTNVDRYTSDHSAYMPDRFWKITSPLTVYTANIELNYGAQEDCGNGPEGMQACRWTGGAWDYSGLTIQNNQRMVRILGYSMPSNTTRYWGLGQFGVKPNVKVFLDGPYVGGTNLMNDGLRSSDLIPAAEPFSGLSFYMSGTGIGGQLKPSALTTTGNNAIVDWVLLELRNSTNSSDIQYTKPALLQRDGDVVTLDGVSPVLLPVAAFNYFVAVRHRNHFGVMTSTPLALSGIVTNIDFTLPGTGTYGTNARKNNNGVMTLWSGNVLRDAVIKYTGSSNDRDPILSAIGGTVPNNAVVGYSQSDVNMDGTTKYTGTGNDRDPILANIGSTVPTNTITEQLP